MYFVFLCFYKNEINITNLKKKKKKKLYLEENVANLNSGSLQVQILFAACRKFAIVRISRK